MGANIFKLTCLALGTGCTVGLLAQGPATDTTPLSLVAMRGCLAKGDAAPVKGGPNAAVGSSGSATFMLTKASLATATQALLQNAASQDKIPKAAQYRLEGAESMLAPYVGRQVEVTASVDAAGAAKPAGSGANAPSLKVQAVQMLGTSCS